MIESVQPRVGPLQGVLVYVIGWPGTGQRGSQGSLGQEEEKGPTGGSRVCGRQAAAAEAPFLLLASRALALASTRAL